MGIQAPHILIAGGGTGGHLFPALAIADEIRKLEPSSSFLFVGTKGKIEDRVVPQRGYPFRRIWISGFHRRLTIDNLLFPLKVVVSVIQSLFVIRQYRPHVVVGTGGYVCGPILFTASLLGIPTVIHESNSYPGVTTRFLAGRVTLIFIAFDAARKWLKRTDHVRLVGTPTREGLGSVSKEQGRAFFHLPADRWTILVFGGSLGAASINDAVLASIPELLAFNVQLIWQTGRGDFDRVQNAVGNRTVGWIGPFIDKMEFAFGAADLVVSRAGATTIAELTCVGKPAIVVPYPFAAGDHQTHNARSLADEGAAILIEDKDVQRDLATTALDLLNNSQRLTEMSKASAKLGRPEAGRAIAADVLQMIQ